MQSRSLKKIFCYYYPSLKLYKAFNCKVDVKFEVLLNYCKIKFVRLD